MGWVIEMTNEHYDRLRQHLRGDVEQVAFLFTEPYAGDQRLRVRHLHLISGDEFSHQSGYHVELADEVRPTLIKRAWDEDACLIEAHSHLQGPARFSWSDMAGFEDWVRHIKWRLQGRPYAALVIAADGFDALVWDDEEPASIDALEVVPGRHLEPTGYTLQPSKEKKRPWWRRILGG
jgi:hypothetical protein